MIFHDRIVGFGARGMFRTSCAECGVSVYYFSNGRKRHVKGAGFGFASFACDFLRDIMKQKIFLRRAYGETEADGAGQ